MLKQVQHDAALPGLPGFRHPELVSGSSGSRVRAAEDWMLKQVQHDAALPGLPGFRHPELVSGSSWPRARAAADWILKQVQHGVDKKGPGACAPGLRFPRGQARRPTIWIGWAMLK
jgi:hypothetical protein